MALTKGTKVVVKDDAAYINAGAKATVEVDQVEGSIWLNVKWDEPKGDRVNGDYLVNSFDVVEPEKVDQVVAIAALVDKVREDAFAEGAKTAAPAPVISDDDKKALREAFEKLNKHSLTITQILQRNGIV